MNGCINSETISHCKTNNLDATVFLPRRWDREQTVDSHWMLECDLRNHVGVGTVVLFDLTIEICNCSGIKANLCKRVGMKQRLPLCRASSQSRAALRCLATDMSHSLRSRGNDKCILILASRHSNPKPPAVPVAMNPILHESLPGSKPIICMRPSNSSSV